MELSPRSLVTVPGRAGWPRCDMNWWLASSEFQFVFDTALPMSDPHCPFGIATSREPTVSGEAVMLPRTSAGSVRSVLVHMFVA